MYLESALRVLRTKGPARPESDLSSKLPLEIVYADDTDFISLSKEWLAAFLDEVPETLATFNLIANKEKTEWTEVSAKSEVWRKTRKIGSLLRDEEDMKRRMQLASAQFNKLCNVWRHHKVISKEVRLRLFRACIEPQFLYACGTWGATEDQLESIDVLHRKFLRVALNIKFTRMPCNKTLYITSS